MICYSPKYVLKDANRKINLFNNSFLFFILQCVVNFSHAERKCPHPGCYISVASDSPTVKWFEAILDEMFREYEAIYTPPAEKGSGKEILNITVLNGDATQIPYSPSMSMFDVQRSIRDKLHIPVNKQKILYNNKMVQVLIYLLIFCVYIHGIMHCGIILFSNRKSWTNIVFLCFFLNWFCEIFLLCVDSLL